MVVVGADVRRRGVLVDRGAEAAKSVALAGGAAALWIASLGACFPGDRPLAPNVVCEGKACSCAVGYDSCDGVADTGCETYLLMDARHCGACGVRCDNGRCLEGSCVANEGYVDCNARWDDGFEAHLPSDPRHCGECGHDCLGGSCIDGRCQPFLMSEPGVWTFWVSADETHVYFFELETSAIMRLDPSQRTVDVIAVDQDCEGRVSVSGDAVYWAAYGPYDEEMFVLESSIEHRTTRILGRAELIGSVRASAEVVAWNATADDGTDDTTIVARVGSDAEPAVRYRTTQTLGALAIATEYVYFLEYDADQPAEPRWLKRIAARTGPPLGIATPVANLGTVGVQSLRATDSHVYWVEWLTAPSEGGAYRVMQLAVGTEQPVERYRGVNHPASYVAMDADASGIYWAERGGASLLRLSTADEAPEQIARYAIVDSLAVGPGALFWSDGWGRLYGLAKKEHP